MKIYYSELKARQAANSKEYIRELFSNFEQQIFKSSVLHISWAKADFYENLIFKPVIQKSEPK